MKLLSFFTKPKKFSDIIPDYKEYVRLQKEDYCSFESDNKHWSEGQERYIKQNFSKTKKDTKILDMACGDGVGLKTFKKLKFTNITGVEFNSQKAKKALIYGYPVEQYDMHKLKFGNDVFDIAYSSHTLEHSYQPSQAIGELHRVLKPKGLLYVVLPYPDNSHPNDKAHGAKYELGTYQDDDGKAVKKYFEKIGFQLVSKIYDHFREPEIWLKFRKV